jgi:hypothetical protein
MYLQKQSGDSPPSDRRESEDIIPNHPEEQRGVSHILQRYMS